MRRLLLLMSMLALGGCMAQHRPATMPTTAPAASEHRPADAQPAGPQILTLQIYQISMPLGSVSRQTAFWKRINEDCIDISTRELLQTNDIRVGEAPNSEWGYFKKFIDANPATVKRSVFNSPRVPSFEMEMGPPIYGQTLWVRGMSGFEGRTYDECRNLMILSFEPAAREPNQVRVSLCPMVRAMRKRLQYNALNGEAEITYVSPEKWYDLNLCADIPLGEFLIIAPTAEGRGRCSVGTNFLIQDAATERVEQILIFVPQPLSTPVIEVPLGKDIPEK